jgi:molybdenum cofactor synthesis domain-containing protein
MTTTERRARASRHLGLAGRVAVAEESGATPGRFALVLTVSDGVSLGTREDTGGARLRERVEAAGFAVTTDVVPDDIQAVATAVMRAVGGGARLVVTTGGTGLGPRDRTPEALRTVLELEVPGLGEQMRAFGRSKTPLADLSRSLGGVIGSTLILAVPGSPSGAIESFDAVAPLLDHALEILAGRTTHVTPRASDGGQA